MTQYTEVLKSVVTEMVGLGVITSPVINDTKQWN